MPFLVAEGMSQENADKYQHYFNQQQITKDIALDLTRTDLKDLGIPFGDMIRMEKAFKKMKLGE